LFSGDVGETNGDVALAIGYAGGLGSLLLCHLLTVRHQVVDPFAHLGH
jgi:hypothetical protein